MSDEQQQVRKVVKFISRNLRLTLVCLLCGLTAGLTSYLLSSKVYKATALIMYQQQLVNPTKMSPDVETRMLEMVNNVGQQVTSRNNLEEIIVANGLYPALRKSLPIDDVIATMRSEHITVAPRQKTNVFEVSFVGDEARQVMLTANALAAKFIEENIRFREQRVTETSAYIKDELGLAKSSMDKQEAAMRDYKLQHYNEMPEQNAANITQLSTLQTQYQNIQNNLQDLKRTQVLIQEQISVRKDILGRLGEGGGDPSSELARVQQELATIRSRYTDNHPDVRRLQGRLNLLLKAQNEAGGEGKPAAEMQPGGNLANIGTQDKQLAQLDRQLKETEISMDRLSREQEAARQKIGQVQRWVEATPVREAEWAALTRDYSQSQQHYQALVSKNLDANSAEFMELRQKGSQFSILESAIIPSQPFSPNFRKFMLIASVLGLGMGLSIAYAMEFLDSSFKDVDDLEAFLGLPVTIVIPLIQTADEKKQLRQRNIIWAVALGAGFVILSGGMLLLWWLGKIIF